MSEVKPPTMPDFNAEQDAASTYQLNKQLPFFSWEEVAKTQTPPSRNIRSADVPVTLETSVLLRLHRLVLMLPDSQWPLMQKLLPVEALLILADHTNGWLRCAAVQVSHALNFLFLYLPSDLFLGSLPAFLDP